MLRVKNSEGQVIDGLFKPCDGVVIVNNTKQYDKYKQQLLQQQKITSLENQVKQLTALIEQLLDKN